MRDVCNLRYVTNNEILLNDARSLYVLTDNNLFNDDVDYDAITIKYINKGFKRK